MIDLIRYRVGWVDESMIEYVIMERNGKQIIYKLIIIQ